MTKTKYTVARYLADRFSQLGVRKMFGVPGNHLGPCLSLIKAHSEIEWVGTTNELNAGFAADGYARCQGLGVVGVTYGVGAFSLINTIAGAFVEHVPLVVINAAPDTARWQRLRATGLLTSHMSERSESNLNAYRQVTASAQVITNSHLAPRQIDAALEICLTEMRPVYLEIREDVFIGPCHEPVGSIAPRPRPLTPQRQQQLELAIEASARKIRAVLGDRGKEKTCALWAGNEIRRFELRDALIALAEATRFPIFTTILGKGLIPEDHPRWHGVYNGKASLREVRRIFESAALKIGLGAWTTSKNLGGTQALGEDWIRADHEGVFVGSRFFPEVELGAFMNGLLEAVNDEASNREEDIDVVTDLYAHLAADDSTDAGSGAFGDLGSFQRSFFAPLEGDGSEWSYDEVIRMINTFLADESQHGERYATVADAGFSLLSAQNLHVRATDSFHAQAAWLSIGYSVPAALGVGEASRDGGKPARVLVFVGDGAFQETCQALSDHTRLNHRTVVFVFDNQAFYGIEQMLVDAEYFKEGSGKEPDHYNLLHPWSYAELHRVFGSARTPMRGEVVRNRHDLRRVLRLIAADGQDAGPLIVQVVLPRTGYPASIDYRVHPEEHHGQSRDLRIEDKEERS